MELVSIIMPAYNAERYISESIESVLGQTYKNWELIIVDDGSDDNTQKIALQYVNKYNRIKYIHQTNQKQGKARNEGIKHCKGKLIAFLDSDDLWCSEKLEIQIEFLKNHETDLLFSDGYIFQHSIHDIKGTFDTLNGFIHGDDALELFLARNRIPMLSVLTTKRAIEEVSGFEEDKCIQNVEDYQLWLKMLIKGFSFYGLTDKLVYYRQHPMQITSIDPIVCKKVFYMFETFINVPSRLSPLFDKAKAIWGRNWYNWYANDLKSASEILSKMSSSPQLKGIIILTRLSLVLFGLGISKTIINKLISYRFK